MRYLLFALLISCSYKDPRPAATAAEMDFLTKYENILKDEGKFKYISTIFSNGYTIKATGANIMYQKACTPDEALQVFQDRLHHFMKLANSDEKMRENLDPYPLTQDRLRFAMSFWDKEMDRPGRPFVAKITFDGELATLHFKEEDSEALDPVTKEIALEPISQPVL